MPNLRPDLSSSMRWWYYNQLGLTHICMILSWRHDTSFNSFNSYNWLSWWVRFLCLFSLVQVRVQEQKFSLDQSLFCNLVLYNKEIGLKNKMNWIYSALKINYMITQRESRQRLFLDITSLANTITHCAQSMVLPGGNMSGVRM